MPTVNVLVTGASGFIGAHLVARLLSEGRRVTVLARSSSALPPEWDDRISVIACDDFTERGLRRLLHAPFDTVFHLAAYGVRPNHRDIDEMIRINVELPATLVRLCTEWRARMIMAGTFSEYRSPSTQEPLTEDSPLEQGKLYGSSKAAGGLMASAIAKSNGTDFRLLRLFKVYGAGEAPHRLLPALVSGLTKRERVAISAGTQILDFVYIDDVIEAMLRADSHCRDKGGIATWNVSTGRAHSVRDFAERVAAAMGADASLLGFGAINMRRDDEPWLVGSPDLLRSELGWQPSVGLDEGVRAAVAVLCRAQSAE
ncbi:NAD(P)-dependent oxidoreductase [Bradyrhizobium sp. IC3123]|uniref:NAD-dependent epimerase/dehydratase family protein n=1 Tax=Bradyrhizobium sp. IC3123 TaxID=2793803 RepID=UPI001CD3AB4C|nr:NAD(P)-dependent oxidoreductase [Bradyrhizobium sp. IC3123]MCA1393362.1 NAD(P)-dependent oxidoreductase [Bradyrhizobium sp. IC3123]